MSFIPGYANDIFISYAHDDNVPLYEGQKGWVDSFDHALTIRLRQLLGARDKLTIWRDPRMPGTAYVTTTLLDGTSRAAILIVILSPSYLSSPWCMKELKEFGAAASGQSGIRIGNTARIAKVIKTPVLREEHPAEISDLLGFEFYQINPATGFAEEFSHETSPDRDKRYWDKLEDLAQALRQVIDLMKAPPPKKSSTPRGVGIYLAETTSDLNAERDKVKRELQQFGYDVLPDRQLPMSAPALQEAVREHLKRCRLSVHFVGEYYGAIPEMEPERSVVRLQHELALQRAADAQFSRLIWIPPGLQPQEERQRKFITELQNTFASNNGSELLQVKLEDLKTIIQTKLTEKPKSEPGASKQTDPKARFYVICDQQDHEAANELKDYLYNRECEATLPLFTGTDAEILQDHKDNLLLCDAVLIFQGQAGEGWLRMKLRELIKLPGYGRTSPLIGKAIYLGAPPSPAKELFQTREAKLVRNYGNFAPIFIEDFVTEIINAKGGSL